MKQNIELLRLIAVTLIVFTHTRHNFESGVFYFVIEKIPTFGTMVLSIISGYLYWSISRNKKKLFEKKVKSLLVPYFIANSSVIVLVLISNYVFGYNALNRLSFDYTLLTEGLLSLNSPPVNPPTYFVRDIFIVFVLAELLFKKNFKMLFIIIPLAFFGKLILRYDVLIAFIIGAFIAQYYVYVLKYKKTIISIALLFLVLTFIYFPFQSKFFIAIIAFVSVTNLNFKFVEVGGYSYLLHLYHSPVIVILYPVLSIFITNPYFLVIIQIILALFFCYLLYLFTRKFKFFKILSGGR